MSNAPLFRALVVKDFRQRLTDPIPLLMWLMIPLIIGGLMTIMMGGDDGPKPVAKLLVVDADQSMVSRLLVSSLSQGELGELIETEMLDSNQARSRLTRGEASALLRIPAGFGEAVLTQTPQQLTLLTNPAQRILPGILEGVMRTLVEAVHYLHLLLGEELKLIGGYASLNPPQFIGEDQAIADLGVSINQAINSVIPYLDPMVIDLEIAAAEREVESPDNLSMAAAVVPGLIIMGLFFCAQGLADEYWREREGNTLSRICAAPGGQWQFALAKLVSASITLLVVAAMLLTVATLYHGLDLQRALIAVLWTPLAGLLLYAMMVVIQILAGSRKAAGVISTLIVLPLLMAGGSFFPLESMPGWLAAVGRLSPNGFLVDRLSDYLVGGGAMAGLGSGLGIALLAMAPLVAVTILRLRSFAQG